MDDDIAFTAALVVDVSIAIVGASLDDYFGVTTGEGADDGSAGSFGDDVAVADFSVVAAVVEVIAGIADADGNGSFGESDSDVGSYSYLRFGGGLGDGDWR